MPEFYGFLFLSIFFSFSFALFTCLPPQKKGKNERCARMTEKRICIILFLSFLYNPMRTLQNALSQTDTDTKSTQVQTCHTVLLTDRFHHGFHASVQSSALLQAGNGFGQSNQSPYDSNGLLNIMCTEYCVITMSSTDNYSSEVRGYGYLLQRLQEKKKSNALFLVFLCDSVSYI